MSRLLSPFMPYIAGALLAAALGLGGYVWSLRASNASLTADNARLLRNAAVLEGQVEQARLAASVAAARAARAQEMNAEASAKIEAIRNLEIGGCADENLPDDLADLLGRRNVPAD